MVVQMHHHLARAPFLTMDKKIVIYCSASGTIDPAYNEAAREFVRAAVAAGYEIVSGGTVKGTMGVISDEIAACGGRHKGILPRFMEPLAHPGLTELHFTDTMSVRKEMMREGTCAAVALPGGIGTMDEMMETFTLRKLGQYDGDLYVLNLGGFYDPLAALLDHFVATEMLDAPTRELIHFPKTVKELTDMMFR